MRRASPNLSGSIVSDTWLRPLVTESPQATFELPPALAGRGGEYTRPCVEKLEQVCLGDAASHIVTVHRATAATGGVRRQREDGE